MLFPVGSDSDEPIEKGHQSWLPKDINQMR